MQQRHKRYLKDKQVQVSIPEANRGKHLFQLGHVDMERHHHRIYAQASIFLASAVLGREESLCLPG
eukprot:983770-Amphidinium_carterae.2